MVMKDPLFSVTLKDCVVQTFRAGGKGGQHQNTTETGVRVIHEASGAVGEARDSRSQADNKRSAFARMAKTDVFQKWARLEASRRLQKKTIEEVVAGQLKASNIKIEVRTEEGWVVDTESEDV